MSTFEVDPLTTSPERLSLDEAFAQAVYEAQVLPEDEQQREEAAIDAVAADYATKYLLESDQQKVAIAANVLRWFLYAEPGGELPEGLVYEDNRGGWPPVSVQADRRIFGLTQLQQTLSVIYLKACASRHDMVDKALLKDGSPLHRLVWHHPILEYLRSFDAGQSDGERPLNNKERQLAGKIIEEEARLNDGIDRAADINPQTFAGRKIAAGKLLLDWATKRDPHVMGDAGPSRKNKQPSGGWQRLKAHYWPRVQKYVSDEGYDLSRAENGGFEVWISKEGEESISYFDLIEDITNDIIGEITDAFDTGSEQLDSLCHLILRQTLEALFNPTDESPSISVDESLKHVIKHAHLSNFEMDALIRFPTVHWKWPINVLGARGRLLPYEDNRGIPYHYNRSHVDACVDSLDSLGPGLGTTEEFLNEYTTYTVESLSGSNHQLAGRMLLEVDKGSVSSQPVPDRPLDFIMNYTLWVPEGKEPYIPGFSTVQLENRKYGFIKQDTDPYGFCDVPVLQENLPGLAAFFDRLGAVQIVDALASAENLTVGDLEAIIARGSDYYLPDEHERVSDFSSSNRGEPARVQNGRLQIQCLEAGKLQREVLGRLFGDHCMSFARGNLINQENDTTYSTTNIGHVQTVFAHEGRQYILDSTPGMKPEDQAKLQSMGYKGGLNSFSGNVHDKRYQNPLPDIQKAFDDRKPTQSVAEQQDYYDPSEHIEEEADFVPPTPAELRHQLEKQLVAIFRLKDKRALYRYLPKANRNLPGYKPVPHRDPVVRSLLVLALAETGTQTSDESVKALAYVRNYPEIHRKFVSSHQRKFYSSAVLNLLENALSQLSPNRPQDT